MSQEEAFRIATATLGAAAGSTGGQGDDQAPRLALPHIANAILWAVLMIASALVLSRSGAEDSASFLLAVVYLPLWFASDLLLTRYLRRPADG